MKRNKQGIEAKKPTSGSRVPWVLRMIGNLAIPSIGDDERRKKYEEDFIAKAKLKTAVYSDDGCEVQGYKLRDRMKVESLIPDKDIVFILTSAPREEEALGPMTFVVRHEEDALRRDLAAYPVVQLTQDKNSRLDESGQERRAYKAELVTMAEVAGLDRGAGPNGPFVTFNASSDWRLMAVRRLSKGEGKAIPAKDEASAEAKRQAAEQFFW